MVQQGLEVALFGAALRVGLCLDGFARDGRSRLRREADRSGDICRCCLCSNRRGYLRAFCSGIARYPRRSSGRSPT